MAERITIEHALVATLIVLVLEQGVIAGDLQIL